MGHDRSKHILLIGLRASGKSTLARLLGARLGMDHLDLDARTPSVAGRATVAEMIERDGLDAFREAEATALAQVLDEPAAVISLGGGSPTAPGAAQRIVDAEAPIVYLRAQPETLVERLEADDNAHRPSLSGKPITEEIVSQFRTRDPLYRDLAWHVINVDELELDEVLREVEESIGERSG
ncbi:MAG: shikimate kinase [Planctomycetota bacterium]